MARTKEKIVWGKWYRSETNGPAPSGETLLDGAVEAVLGQPEMQSSSGDSQIAATAISYSAAAWPVSETESRTGHGTVQHGDSREVRCGWIVRITRASRWQGEGISHDWTYYPGDCPKLSSLFDNRFDDPYSSHQWVSMVEFWRIRKYLRVA